MPTVALPFHRDINFDGTDDYVPVSQYPGGSTSHYDTVVVNGITVTGYSHNAYDFALPEGADVLAVTDGTVVFVSRITQNDQNPPSESISYYNETVIDPSGGAGGYGNYLILAHEYTDDEGDTQTFYTMYAHLDGGTIAVEVGDTVNTGAILGEVGQTGVRDSVSGGDGAHLHFQFGTSLFHPFGGSGQNIFGTTTIVDGRRSSLGEVSAEDFLVFEGYPDGLLPLVRSTTSFSYAFPTEPKSFQDILDEYERSRTLFDTDVQINGSVVDEIDELAELIVQHYLGHNVYNVEFNGSGAAAYLVSDLGIAEDLGLTDRLRDGILLTTGGYPDDLNDNSGFTVPNGTGGDPDLTTSAQLAFGGSGATQDAVTIEFTINITDPDIRSMEFDVVFGSEEYPEFVDSSFVDIAAIYVRNSETLDDNGEQVFENFALFDPDDVTAPLSVIQDNIDLHFIDNTSAALPIEWDGVSNLLNIGVPLVFGLNTIKIGVADTGDSSLDSGLYIHDMKLSTSVVSNQGVLTVRQDDLDTSTVISTAANELIVLADDSNTVAGNPEDLDGDRIVNFGPDDLLQLYNTLIALSDILSTFGSLVLDIDTDGDGVFDTNITLEGDYTGAELNVENVGVDSFISVVYNSTPEALDDEFSVYEDEFLTGNILDDNGNGSDSDPDGDALMVSLVSGPAEGSLVLNDDGSFTYEADADVFDLATPGEVITQSFTYQINDGNGETDQATATINVTVQDDGQVVGGTNKRDVLKGTDGGEDTIFGGNGKDILYGFDGADALYGGNADDFLFGGESVDSLFGERGDDKLFGEQGEDHLDGGRGNDLLRGGLDDDILVGGRGDDVFVLALGEGTDTILDYGVGGDHIGLVGLKFEDLLIEQSGDDATISADGEILAVLTGVDSLMLGESDVFNFI